MQISSSNSTKLLTSVNYFHGVPEEEISALIVLSVRLEYMERRSTVVCFF